jgi:hypothetical protein
MTHPHFDFDAELLRLLDEDRTRHSWAALHAARSLESIALSLRHISIDLHAIRGTMVPLHHLTESRITLMPKSINVGQTANAVISATKADGSPFAITTADTVALVAANPANATLGAPVINADGTVTVPVTGAAPDPGDAITATVDGVASQPDTLTVTTAAPATVTVTLQ